MLKIKGLFMTGPQKDGSNSRMALPDLCDTFPESDTGRSGVMDTEDVYRIWGSRVTSRHVGKRHLARRLLSITVREPRSEEHTSDEQPEQSVAAGCHRFMNPDECERTRCEKPKPQFTPAAGSRTSH